MQTINKQCCTKIQVNILMDLFLTKPQRLLLKHHNKYWLNPDFDSSSENNQEPTIDVDKAQELLKDYRFRSPIDDKNWQSICAYDPNDKQKPQPFGMSVHFDEPTSN